MPRSKPFQGAKILLLPFDTSGWGFVLLATAATAAFYFLHSRVWPRRDGLSFGDLVFYEGAVALKESDRLSHRTNLTEGLRVMNAFFIMGALILTTAYSGSLVSFYSVDVYPDPANTFDELEKKVAEEGIEIRVCCSHIRLAMRESSNPFFNYLGNLPYDRMNIDDALVRIVDDRDFGYVFTKNGLELYRRMTDKRASYHGSYVARECFLPVNVGLGLRKDSSFKDVIDLRLEQLREAGILPKLIRDGHALAGGPAQEMSASQYQAWQREADKLSMKDLQGIFEVSGIMLAIVAAIFLLERPYRKITKKLEQKLPAMKFVIDDF